MPRLQADHQIAPGFEMQHFEWRFVYQVQSHQKLFFIQYCPTILTIAQIRDFMSTKTTEKLIYAFVTSRIDSCNALLFGIPEKKLSKLQTVQNCAARLVEHAKRRDPVTPNVDTLALATCR